MKYEIVNKYSEAENLCKPVSKKPFTVGEIISLLNEGATRLFPSDKRPRANSHIMTRIKLFQHFLESTERKGFSPDESLLEEFRSKLRNGDLKGKGDRYGPLYTNSAVDTIRLCLNQYLYPQGLIDRLVLTKKVYDKYSRFFRLTKTTRRLIVAFEEDGRSIASEKKFYVDSKGGESCRIQIKRKQERLSSYNRKCYLEKVLTVLNSLVKSGIEDLTGDDLQQFLEQYRKKDKEQTARGYLAALYSVVANGVALKLLQRNPFENFPLERKRCKVRQDFVMLDQIDKLLNLKPLDWENPNAVRNRCVTALIYDMGLRASTVTQLEVTDVKELPDGRYRIMVRGIFLKGDKQDATLYVLFQQTIPLLRHWIHVVRPTFHPRTDHLFVSQLGKKLTRTGIRNIVRNCCKSLDIWTVKGKTPSPHTLRHTLATLNTEPFGKGLSPRLMQQRLIHMDVETLIRNYVHNNPLAEMEEYKKLLEKGSKNRLLRKVNREDFFEILDSLSSAKPKAIFEIKRAYERELEYDNPLKGSDEEGEFITESEAIRRLSAFRIDYRSLRTWALKEGFCRIESMKKDRQRYFYKASFIDELVKNYIEKDEAMGKFRGKRSTFYYRLKMCRVVKIGQRFFIPKDDFLRFFIDGTVRTKKGKVQTRFGSSRTPLLSVGRFAT